MVASLFPTLQTTCAALQEATQVSPIHHAQADRLIAWLRHRRTHQQPIRLNFICTHNSRRSHLAQVWAQTWAHLYGISGVQCYSGGTAVTALYPQAAATLAAQGFDIQCLTAMPNPIYALKYAANEPPIISFSKVYDDPFNPASDFAAIMMCQSANEACPHVTGAALRCALPFADPKSSDGSPQEAATYAARSLEIAALMAYIMQAATLSP